MLQHGLAVYKFVPIIIYILYFPLLLYYYIISIYYIIHIYSYIQICVFIVSIDKRRWRCKYKLFVINTVLIHINLVHVGVLYCNPDILPPELIRAPYVVEGLYLTVQRGVIAANSLQDNNKTIQQVCSIKTHAYLLLRNFYFDQWGPVTPADSSGMSNDNYQRFYAYRTPMT